MIAASAQLWPASWSLSQSWAFTPQAWASGRSGSVSQARGRGKERRSRG